MKKTRAQGLTPTTTIRLPETLHKEIKDAAGKNGHSMNAEIIHRLSTSVGKPLQMVAEQNEKTHELLKEILNKLSTQ